MAHKRHRPELKEDHETGDACRNPKRIIPCVRNQVGQRVAYEAAITAEMEAQGARFAIVKAASQEAWRAKREEGPVSNYALERCCLLNVLRYNPSRPREQVLSRMKERWNRDRTRAVSAR